MAQHAGAQDDGFQTRIAIMEELLQKVVNVHVSTATHVQSLDEKLSKLEMTASTISGFIRKMDALSNNQETATSRRNLIAEELKQGMEVVRSELTEMQAAMTLPIQQIDERLKKTEEMIASMHAQFESGGQRADQPMIEKLNELSRVPEMISAFGSQQSVIIQTLEKRIDPRLMIYLKPLIEMLEEEGRQAERMKDDALRRLHGLMSSGQVSSNQEIASMLEDVSGEITKCQAAFERTQQALQIVVTPFQNIGQLFRGNLEIIVQAHDMLAQLYQDLPKFALELKALHAEQSRNNLPPPSIFNKE
jgi:hypothetical protein